MRLWKTHCKCLEQNSIGKRPKDFEASDFPSCILNKPTFVETNHRNQKNFMMSGKVRTFSKQNGICKRYFEDLLYYEDFVYLCYRQTKWYMQKIPSVTGIICAKSQKLQHMYVIGLILLSTKHHKTHFLYPATYYCTRLQGVKERTA